MGNNFFSKSWVKAIITLMVIGLIFFGYRFMNSRSTPSTAQTVEAREEQVSMGDITIGFTGDGSAEIPIVNLNFELSGKLKELYVSPGDVIKKGQMLARLENAEYQNKLQTSEINYKKALYSLDQKIENNKTSLISEKQKLNELLIKQREAELQVENMVDLEEYYAKQEIEQAKVTLDSAKTAYEIQLESYNNLLSSTREIDLENLNVESARISLDMAKNDLDNTILLSPLTATVLNIAYKPGETVSAGTSSGKATADTSNFMVVTDSDKVEVVVPVSEIDLAKVQIGQRAEVTFEAYDGQIFLGTVVSVGALPRVEQSGLVSYDVRIALEQGNEIKSGMTCFVSFIMRQTKNVLIIANKAVSMEDGKQVVRVKEQNGEISTRVIKTGLTDGKNVEVTEGLNMGDIVLVGGNK